MFGGRSLTHKGTFSHKELVGSTAGTDVCNHHYLAALSRKTQDDMAAQGQVPPPVTTTMRICGLTRGAKDIPLPQADERADHFEQRVLRGLNALADEYTLH